MKIGFIGLGRMGKALVLNALEHNHTIIAHNRSPDPIKEVAEAGAIPAYTLEEMFSHLKNEKTKVIWLMLTAGSLIDEKIKEILPFLSKGDVIIDGGNSWYKDSQRRSQELSKHGINFIDCGTSGGISGARNGACMMLGGNSKTFTIIEPFVKSVCTHNGYAHVGSSGSGHFVKMVHNGIEYGMMAALGEGFEALNNHEKEFSLNLKNIAKVYAHGSIVEGKLSTLLEKGMVRDDFKDIKGTVPKGETEDEMEKLESLSPMPILHQSRLQRVKSRSSPSFSAKIMAMLRNEFGGHSLNK